MTNPRFERIAISLGLIIISACVSRSANLVSQQNSQERKLASQAQQAGNFDCDLVILDASTGGVAAALAALKQGTSTCMSAMTDWVGGQLTVQGVAAVDSPWHLGNEAKDEVERTMRPFLDKLTHKGSCWVSRDCFRPSEGDAVLKSMLAPYVEKGLLKIFYESVLKRVRKNERNEIVAIDLVSRRYTGTGARPYNVPLSSEILDWYDEADSERYTKSIVTLRGKIFMDGSETGELIALSNARHHLGWGDEFDNPEDSECVMAFTYPSNLAARAATPAELARLAAIHLPGNSNFDIHQVKRFKFWKDFPEPADAASVFDYRKISDDPPVTMMNWNPGNDFWRENFIVPYEKLGPQLNDWRGGVRPSALKGAEDQSLGFVKWLNEQPDVSWQGRGAAPIFDLDAADNFFGTGTGLSKFPYVRETRRMEGFGGFRVKAADIGTDSVNKGVFPDPELYTNWWDSVGIGSYAFDERACPTGKQVGADSPYVKHAQIPLRALISANIPNLLAANKTWSVTQQANTGLRLHPIEWNVGFGGGLAASLALKNNMNMHAFIADRAKVTELQRNLVANGQRVLWFSDELPPESAH